MVNRLYLQYNYDSSNLSFSKTLILSILPPPPSSFYRPHKINNKKRGFAFASSFAFILCYPLLFPLVFIHPPPFCLKRLLFCILICTLVPLPFAVAFSIS